MYILGLVIAIVIIVLAAIWVFLLKEENIKKREGLARNHWLGSILVVIDFYLLWPHLEPVLPLFLAKIQLILVVVAAFLAIAFLDYLFSRALGGLLILGCYFLVHENFYNYGFTYGFFPALCYLFGLAGIFIAGKPALLRDYFRKCARKAIYKNVSLAVMGAFVVCAIISLITVLAK
ncbi:hypothetical protein AAEX28_08080 [Lentisphaerota bacterium WC36G]|nr:hypothetical protein LJT99_10935 [Lentisphaerae bacterium WC36]